MVANVEYFSGSHQPWQISTKNIANCRLLSLKMKTSLRATIPTKYIEILWRCVHTNHEKFGCAVGSNLRSSQASTVAYTLFRGQRITMGKFQRFGTQNPRIYNPAVLNCTSAATIVCCLLVFHKKNTRSFNVNFPPVRVEIVINVYFNSMQFWIVHHLAFTAYETATAMLGWHFVFWRVWSGVDLEFATDKKGRSPKYETHTDPCL